MADPMKELIADAQAQGFRIRPGGKKHIVFLAPNGRDVVSVPKTTKYPRSIENAKADLRRAGYRPKR